MTASTKGILAGLAAATLWGSGGVAGKYILNQGADPFSLTQARMSATGLLFLAWLLLTNRRALKIQPRDYLYFAVIGIIGVGGVTGAYLAAIARLQVAAAILIQYLAPMMIAVYAWAFRGERLGILRLAALGLAFGGCFVVVGGYNLSLLSLNRVGLIWGLVSALTFAFYSLSVERGLRRYSPWTVACYTSLFAGLGWTLIKGPFGILEVGGDPIAWLAFGWFVVMSTLVPFGLYFFAISQIKPTRASIATLVEPLAGGLIAWAALGEVLSLWQILGGLAVLAAVVLIRLEKEGCHS